MFEVVVALRGLDAVFAEAVLMMVVRPREVLVGLEVVLEGVVAVFVVVALTVDEPVEEAATTCAVVCTVMSCCTLAMRSTFRRSVTHLWDDVNCTRICKQADFNEASFAAFVATESIHDIHTLIHRVSGKERGAHNNDQKTRGRVQWTTTHTDREMHTRITTPAGRHGQARKRVTMACHVMSRQTAVGMVAYLIVATCAAVVAGRTRLPTPGEKKEVIQTERDDA